jgi:hypothetical protein
MCSIRVLKVVLSVSVLLLLTSGSTRADNLMPSFSTVPTGWSTDRYAPNSFSNVGTYQGRDNVLGIGISNAQGELNRPAGYQGYFYDTQGDQYQLNMTGPNSISADLWIPDTWANPSLGNRRTDMWGVMTDGSAVSGYPIIGFTNYDGFVGFRWWDDSLGVWNDLTTVPVNYDAWTTLTIVFTGSAYDYLVNWSPVATENSVNGSTGFQATIMQAYNFEDPVNFPTAIGNDYTAYWSDATPEPGSIVLLGSLATFVGIISRRRTANRT